MKRQIYIKEKAKFIIAMIFFVLLLASPEKLFSQEFPPRPIKVTVSVVQNLNFGTFYQGTTGGSVIIYPDGSRSATGDIVLLPGTFSTGLYDVVANKGTIISILGFNSVLTGSNGGTMTLQIGTTDPTAPFIIPTVPPASTQVRIGGTLIVGNPLSNPPGIYSGTFNVTFFQE